jgi:hypothetical protein
MAPPPYYMLITHSVSFDITFGVCQHHHNVGSRHLPVVHVRLTSKLKQINLFLEPQEEQEKEHFSFHNEGVFI